MGKHNALPDTPEWQAGALPDGDIEELHKGLSNVRNLPETFQDLGKGLAVGTARTVYVIPKTGTSRDFVDAIVSGANEASEMIFYSGLEEINEYSAPSLIVRDEAPDEFDVPSIPEKVRSRIPAEFPIEEFPIVYMRAENNGAGPVNSVGAFDPQTQTRFSAPLN